MSSSKLLDCSGLVCPLPVAKTKKTLNSMDPGEVLEIIGDFCEAGENIKRFVENHGHTILDFKVEGSSYHLTIKKN